MKIIQWSICFSEISLRIENFFSSPPRHLVGESHKSINEILIEFRPPTVQILFSGAGHWKENLQSATHIRHKTRDGPNLKKSYSICLAFHSEDAPILRIRAPRLVSPAQAPLLGSWQFTTNNKNSQNCLRNCILGIQDLIARIAQVKGSVWALLS